MVQPASTDSNASNPILTTSFACRIHTLQGQLLWLLQLLFGVSTAEWKMMRSRERPFVASLERRWGMKEVYKCGLWLTVGLDIIRLTPTCTLV